MRRRRFSLRSNSSASLPLSASRPGFIRRPMSGTSSRSCSSSAPVAVMDVRLLGGLARSTAPGPPRSWARGFAVARGWMAVTGSRAVLGRGEPSRRQPGVPIEGRASGRGGGWSTWRFTSSWQRREVENFPPGAIHTGARAESRVCFRSSSGSPSPPAGAQYRIFLVRQNPVKRRSSAATMASRSPATEPRALPSALFRTVTSSCATSTKG